MATTTQIEANRKNSTRSTGPRTAQGKSRARLNSYQHGLAARTIMPVLPQEDARELEERIQKTIVAMQQHHSDGARPGQAPGAALRRDRSRRASRHGEPGTPGSQGHSPESQGSQLPRGPEGARARHQSLLPDRDRAGVSGCHTQACDRSPWSDSSRWPAPGRAAAGVRKRPQENGLERGFECDHHQTQNLAAQPGTHRPASREPNCCPVGSDATCPHRSNASSGQYT